jgi:alginate O-acetyltransferase complex protein AlgI
MFFASLTFLYIFLPLNLILYYVSKNATYRNVLLTVFSFVFYAWGEPVWIALLFLSAIVDWLNALWTDKARGTKWAKAGVITSIIFNVGILIAFKYTGFFIENANQLFGTSMELPKYTLPIGLSFKVFQTISYVVDVYRGEIRTQKSFLKYLMYISLYHHLVAGPIVRYAHIAREVDSRRFNIGDISSGITRFCVGLFKKVCISNVAAIFVDQYMDKGDLSTISIAEAWFGLIAFSLHIYFDFSGYSDMAIGLGKMFGFHYHENFNYPYISKSASEFWRRWHISLGTFFRDYIYIPLGGNRKTKLEDKPVTAWRRFAHRYLGAGSWRGYRNLFIVWFLTGFWHDAGWNFIFWGLFFGVLIALERAFLLKLLSKIPSFISHIYLLFAAVIGWALFHFTDSGRMWSYLGVMFGKGANAWSSLKFEVTFKENVLWFILALVLCMPVYLFVHRKVKRGMVAMPRLAVVMWTVSIMFSLVLLFLATSMLAGKSYNPFIYGRI